MLVVQFVVLRDSPVKKEFVFKTIVTAKDVMQENSAYKVSVSKTPAKMWLVIALNFVVKASVLIPALELFVTRQKSVMMANVKRTLVLL